MEVRGVIPGDDGVVWCQLEVNWDSDLDIRISLLVWNAGF
jgi:hypothetical protein